MWPLGFAAVLAAIVHRAGERVAVRLDNQSSNPTERLETTSKLPFVGFQM